MKLVTFGDSWTEGTGSNIDVEETITDNAEKTAYRNKFAWPKVLADLLNIECINFGAGGCSNKYIFDKVVHAVRDSLINQNDLVIIMWSSSLRDRVPFFVDDEWHVWGMRYKEKKRWFDWLLNNTNFTKNASYNFFIKDYKVFFMENLYTDEYYDIINQNYIIFLQKLFTFFGIKYIFCDAFDIMIRKDIPNHINKTELINKQYYWGFGEKTLKDYIRSIDPTDCELWESKESWENVVGKHPNYKGYSAIAYELNRFILESNLLNIKFDKKINLV